MKHFDMNNIMANSQHRFRKRRSIVIPNWVTIDGIATRMKTGSQVDITLLDFPKILDKVPHKHLLYNLNHYRVNNKMNRWIGSFLENRKQCVHPLTHQFVSGVLQGTLRGPLLSLSYIHVHVMPETTTSSETKLFADDSLFTAQSTTRHTTTYYRKT